MIIITEVERGCSAFAPRLTLREAASGLGIVEILVLLIVALIVIPPENLPEVARATGKILRELRLASNTVMRELTTIDEPTRMTPTPPSESADPHVDKPVERADQS